MFALLRERNFCLLWTAHTISIVGDYVFFIAITFWIYEQTGSAFATGAVLITSTVPAFLFAPLASVLVDRWDRRGIMLVAESARAVLFLGLLASVTREQHALWPIYVVGFGQTAVAAFFWPARSALLPQLIAPPALLPANALYLVSDSGVRILAPALSTFTLLHLGPAGVTILDAASFLISAGCISLLALPPHPRTDALVRGPWSARPANAQRQARRSLDVATRNGQWLPAEDVLICGVRGLFLLGALLAFTAGMLSILLPIFVRLMLSAGPLAYGWMLTAQASGEGAMSLYLGRTPLRPVNAVSVVSGGLALAGLSLILIAGLQTLVAALLLAILFGAVTAAISVQLLTLLQQRVANRVLGRTLATYSGIQAMSQVGGLGIATVVLGRIGVLWLLLLAGALCLLGSRFAWIRRHSYDDRGGGAPR
jgi:MFS transporter, DHA3 family, macrolide efflux protein